MLRRLFPLCLSLLVALVVPAQAAIDTSPEHGLAQSTCVNPDGLPDPPGQMMSALDLAKLSRHIINTYPDLYHYFSEREFVWHNIHQPNRDLVLGSLPGADGLKTGHTDAAGYG